MMYFMEQASRRMTLENRIQAFDDPLNPDPTGISLVDTPVYYRMFIEIPMLRPIQTTTGLIQNMIAGTTTTKNSILNKPTRASKLDFNRKVSSTSTVLKRIGVLNNACGTIISNGNRPIQYFRDPQTGRFTGNPYKANKLLGNISKGTFGVGTAITIFQVANGDVEAPKAALDISVSYVALAGGPNGFAFGVAYFVYDNTPPPTYPQGGTRVVNTNTCHGNQ